ncbi:MAG: ABC transporter permease [Anaerolineae bacterium]
MTRSLNRLLVVARKEFRHITRDLRLLFLVVVAPAFLLVTLSYVFALDVEQVDIAVRDLDRTALSRDLVSHVAADGDFDVVAWLQQGQGIEDLLTRGTADMVLVIPRGFSRTALSGEPSQIQCIVDGVDAIAASQSVGLLESRVHAFVVGVARSRVGLGAESLVVGNALVIEDLAWYNKGLKSLISMVPGLMGLILCMPALAFALALAREKEMGSFESLIVTPVRGFEYLIGKLVAYEVGGIVSGLLALLVGTFWFRVPFRGTVPDFVLVTAAYMIASTGISLVVASMVRNQQTAMFLILMIFFVPSFFIAGLLRPISEEPLARAIAYALPSTHFISISRSLFLKGLGLRALGEPAMALLGIGLICQVVSLLRFNKKLT